MKCKRSIIGISFSVLSIFSCTYSKTNLKQSMIVGTYNNISNPKQKLTFTEDFNYHYLDKQMKFSGTWYISDSQKNEICLNNWKKAIGIDTIETGKTNIVWVTLYDNKLYFSPDNDKYNFIKIIN